MFLSLSFGFSFTKIKEQKERTGSVQGRRNGWQWWEGKVSGKGVGG
jgi:hypothetical protein